MGRVTVNKCDVCGVYFEQRPICYVSLSDSNVDINRHSMYPSIDKIVCSQKCFAGLLQGWYLERFKEREIEEGKSAEPEKPEVRNIVLDGIRVI